MKKVYSIALLLLAAFSVNAQAPIPDLLHYRFNGTSTLVPNYASSPPPGTATGTIIGGQTQSGAINCMGALVGNGLTSTSNYVNTGWAPNISSAWSISFWTSNIIQTTTTYYILGDVNSSNFRVFTGGVAGSGNWILRGGFTDVLLTGAATTTPSMISFVYTPSTNIVGYINGVPTVTVAQTAAPLSGVGPFKVGGYSTNNSLNSGGLLADFRIYSTALTPSDITNIYNFGLGTLTITTSSSPTICAGQSTQISVSGANSYTWSTGAFTSSVTVSPTVSMTYSVTGETGTCTAVAMTTVNVNPQPVVTVSSGTICSGSAFTISPSGANTYTIEGGSAIVSPTANTTYSVIGEDLNGCLSSVINSSVNVNSLPVIAANSGSVCEGQTFTITPTGASTYTYSSGSSVVSPTSTTSYSITGTDANGCVSASPAVSSVTVSANPALTVASSASIICAGQTASLTASGAITYTWSSSSTSAMIVVSPTTTTTYTVTGEDANGCMTTDTLQQMVSPCAGIHVLGAATVVKLYPNPGKGIATLELYEEAQIMIVNSLGELISNEKLSAGTHQINLVMYADGIYFVKLIQRGQQQLIKLVKE